jgi:ketol-acid reductoisomerase
LMRAVFEEMIDHRYLPFFAYAKCIRSLRSVVEVMDQVGIEEYLSRRGSRTMEFAVRKSGPRAIDREEIKKIFQETLKVILPPVGCRNGSLACLTCIE